MTSIKCCFAGFLLCGAEPNEILSKLKIYLSLFPPRCTISIVNNFKTEHCNFKIVKASTVLREFLLHTIVKVALFSKYSTRKCLLLVISRKDTLKLNIISKILQPKTTFSDQKSLVKQFY